MNLIRRILVSLLIATVIANSAIASSFENPRSNSKYLDAAIQTAKWLDSQADSEGTIPDEIGKTGSSPTIGTGSAGRLLFFLELYHATGDRGYERLALREGDLVIKQTPADYKKYGLYNGLAGAALALNELSLTHYRNIKYRTAALERFKRIASAAQWEEGKARWSNSNDVLTGTAGIGLAMLCAAHNFKDPAFSLTALGAGNELLAQAEKKREGLRWQRFNDRELDLPNFSHGTAGIAYFLAELDKNSHDKKYLAAAEKGARYLSDIADKEDGLFLVPYGIPNDGYATKHDIGWAHGSAGTGRLFVKLWQITGRNEYKRIANANARSIIAAGVPGDTKDKDKWTGPFKMDQRFGTSGSSSYLLGLHKITKGKHYHLTAQRIVDQILKSGTKSENGFYWKLPRYGFQGGEGEAVFTGYFYGAAGFGIALLESHYARSGSKRQVRLPDDPF